MAEQLYTIPVNDAFDSECECPLCMMRQELEKNALEYTLGPSYMEDDNRAMTDELGFCAHHIRLLNLDKNRLGLALMLKTHTDKIIRDLKELSNNKPVVSGGFLKKSKISSVGEYTDKLEKSCFICNRINGTFSRYIDTVLHLWKKDEEFRNKFKESKGFCVYHYGILYDEASSKLSKAQYDNFIQDLNMVFFDNMERVNSDLSWFIDKFDYRYKDEPWKNSKDAIPRTIIKSNHSIL